MGRNQEELAGIVKKVFELSLTDDAKKDIQQTFLWYKSIHPELAHKFEYFLEMEIGRILSNPNLFSVKYKKFRVTFLSKFPYGVHYLFRDDTVIVIGVFHTAQNPVNWDKRAKRAN